MTEDLRYPIGPLELSGRVLDGAAREGLISTIERVPNRLRAAVVDLTEEQLDTPYRPGGWTVRQVVHHVPDSHMNGYVRFKWALTEDDGILKPYSETLWSELPDARAAPIAMSLDLLDALHIRWVTFLRMLEAADFERTIGHPEWGALTVDTCLELYAWHGRHHVAHITALREREGW